MHPILRRSLWALGGLAVLLAGFHTVENIRGQRAWSRWKAERRAAGDVFDPEAFAPPAIPDAENFAKHPALASSIKGPGDPAAAHLPKPLMESVHLGSWHKGRPADLEALEREMEGARLTEVLSTYDGALKGLAEAAQRPGCRLASTYGTLDVPAFLGWRNLARALRLRSLVALREGRAEDALRDVLLGLRVVEHFQREPQVLTQLLRMAWVNQLMQPLWEGLQDRRWSADQLQRLQAGLEHLDLLASWRRSLGYERALMRSQVEKAQGDFMQDWLAFGSDQGSGIGPWTRRWARRLVVPKGWVYQSLVMAERFEVQLFDEALKPEQHRVRVRHQEAVERALEASGRTSIGKLAQLQVPAFAAQNLRIARSQVALDHARLACALERYRLARGGYPASLEALVPGQLPDLRPGLLEGIPDPYALAPGGFRLHSVGWDLLDGGGAWPDEVQAKDAPAYATGDWVWSRGEAQSRLRPPR